MKIEAGKFYRTRDGRKVGPMGVWASKVEKATGLPLYDFEEGEFRGNYWRQNGLNGEPGFGKVTLDLVAEWTEEPASPVRERTVREIVPGVYGRIRVSEEAGNGVVLSLNYHYLTATELRAAAATFIQLADALESAA